MSSMRICPMGISGKPSRSTTPAVCSSLGAHLSFRPRRPPPSRGARARQLWRRSARAVWAWCIAHARRAESPGGHEDDSVSPRPGWVEAGRDSDAAFRREAEAIARLQHPNVVQIFEIGASRRAVLALEYVVGGTLADKLGGKPQDPRSSAKLVKTLARAVHYAARERHRPSRPEAGQHPADGRRHAQDHRLRPGPAAGQRQRRRRRPAR